MNVDQATISRRLKVISKIQKCEKLVAHELNKRQMETLKRPVQFFFKSIKRGFYEIVTCDEKCIYFVDHKCKKSWVTAGKLQCRLKNQIDLERRDCSVHGEIRKVWYIMIY